MDNTKVEAGITVETLKKRGYVSLLEIYMKIGLPLLLGQFIAFPHNSTNRRMTKG